MKPKEFDDLVRQVFDQNDFEYSPANWDRLSARMDNKPGKKRHIFWIPLAVLGTVASVAASIAMIITLPAFLQNKNTAPLAHISEHSIIQINTIDQASAIKDIDEHVAVNVNLPYTSPTAKTHAAASIPEEKFALQLPDEQIQLIHPKSRAQHAFSTFSSSYVNQKISKIDYSKKAIADNHFRLDYNEPAYAQKTSISIASGINYGSMLSGYAICATGKRMISDKFYLEGDIAFVSNTATERTSSSSYLPGQKTGYQGTYQGSGYQGNNYSAGEGTSYNQYYASVAPPPPPPPSSSSQGGTSTVMMSARNTRGMRMSGDNSNSSYDPSDKVQEGTPAAVSPSGPDVRESSYNLYYAQLSPSIGYHINKSFSIGVGGDFQRLLLDGKTFTSVDNSGASKEVPSMDVGLIGKGELSINKKIKAGLCYRQGFNNMINGTNKYIDRTYLQVQLKYMIFKK